MKAEEIIRKFAVENKITDIGICSAENFEEARSVFAEKAEMLKGFVESDIEKRINPRITLENAKSIISVAVSYNRKFEELNDGVIRGKISAAAVGRDYHKTVMELLEKLAEELKKEYNFNYKAFVDTGPLSDRAVAVRSGIGSIGKNGCVITKNGGAAVFLGYMITDLELECREGEVDVCKNCGKCVKACPTGALSEFGFDMTKCISYITQIKRELTEEEMRLIGNNVYGCDCCQLACPLNAEAEKWMGSNYQNDNCIEQFAPSLEKLLSYSNKEFKEMYGDTAIFWRGNSIIKRNAIICALNSGKTEAENLIEPFTQSGNILLSKTAEKASEAMKKRK